MNEPIPVLITGGAGFIGSNIVARLAADPAYDVIVCDRLREASLGKWRNLAKHAISDLIAPEDLFAALTSGAVSPRIVIHMGAISSTLETDVDKIVANNFALSRDLFGWCADHGARLIYASSAATYGDGARGFADDPGYEALAALRPLNPYGWSKALFDLFVARQTARGRAPPQCVGLKFFNVYGPNEGHKGAMKSVIAQIWPRVAAGESVKLFRSYNRDYPDGGQLRDFVYVRDAVDAVEWLVKNPDVSGLFNLGSGQARSFADLATAVFHAVDRTPRIDYIDMPPALIAAYQYHTQAPMERLRAAGWPGRPTSLEDGVADYVGTYLSRPDSYR